MLACGIVTSKQADRCEVHYFYSSTSVAFQTIAKLYICDFTIGFTFVILPLLQLDQYRCIFITLQFEYTRSYSCLQSGVSCRSCLSRFCNRGCRKALSTLYYFEVHLWLHVKLSVYAYVRLHAPCDCAGHVVQTRYRTSRPAVCVLTQLALLKTLQQ